MSQRKQDSAAETVVLQFLETSAALERRLDRALSGTKGLNFSEYRLLKALGMAPPSGMSRIELAELVGLTASAVTRALKPLEKLGYVNTAKSERDARQSLASLTAAGQEHLQDAQGILQDTVHALPLSTLSPQKLAAFCERLRELKPA